MITAMVRERVQRTRHAPGAFWFATGAVAWALVVLVGALVTVESASRGTAAAAAAIPLIAATLCWAALHHDCKQKNVIARYGARTMMAALLAFAIVTGFSIGLFVLPVVVLLAVADVRLR